VGVFQVKENRGILISGLQKGGKIKAMEEHRGNRTEGREQWKNVGDLGNAAAEQYKKGGKRACTVVSLRNQSIEDCGLLQWSKRIRNGWWGKGALRWVRHGSEL